MFETLQVIIGLTLLFFGGDTLVKGSVALARNYNVPNIIIALTIVAFGTSAPEFVVSIEAAISGFDDVAVGNIIGSNISNSFLIIGLSALFCAIKFDDDQVKKDILFLLFVTVIYLISMITGQKIILIEGLILVILTICYTIYKIKALQSNKEINSNSDPAKELEEEFSDNLSLKLAYGYSFLGLILLAAGGYTAVEGAVALARIIGISEAVISLTIVAIGSSAPEIAACVASARKGHYDMVIGNVVGSNLFNIVLGLGAVAMFKTINISQKFLGFDFIYLLFSSLILASLAFSTGAMGKKLAVIFILLYSIFIFVQYSSA